MECFGAIRKPSLRKMLQNLCFRPHCTILGYRSCENDFTKKASILLHLRPNDVWECFRAIRKPSARKTLQNLCFRPHCTISGYRSCDNGFTKKHPFYSIRAKMMFGSVSEQFANLRHVKRCKSCVSNLNALFRGTEVEKIISQQKRPFYSIRAKMMFGSVSEQFANLRHVKRCKSCVSDLNALFRGTRVEKMISQQKRPFYSIRAKMMFGSVSEEFTNLEHVKRWKSCVSDLNALFRGTEAEKMISQQKHPFYSIRAKMMFGSVSEQFANLLHVKIRKTCV